MSVQHANRIIGEDMETIASSPLPWQSFSGATVLVSGAAGFLPAYMVETLLFLNAFVLERPARIVALVRHEQRARERFAGYLQRRDFEIIEHDVSRPLTFADPFEYVIHAASQASPMQFLRDPVGTLNANILGTHNLLSVAQKYDARGFLFFSSGAVYGSLTPVDRSIAEHDMGPLDPSGERACYEESKRMGETMCVAWARQFGLPTRIARPWHTYGPGMRLDDGRVFADFVRDILNGGPIVLQSDGQARRCFCYLLDATLGFFTVLLNGANGEAYNVANPDGEVSIRELADRLALLYAGQGVTVEYGASTDLGYAQSPIFPNIDKLKALGWNPVWTIENGFARTVASYRE